MKRNKLLAPLFLAASFLLAGCSSSEIVARPDWSTESIITNITTKDNAMKEIYDAIKAIGTTNSDLLNKVLYEIAYKIIGNYADDTTNDIKGLASISKIKEISEDPEEAAKEYAIINKFVNKYPVYKTTQEVGYYVDAGGATVSRKLTDEEKLKISLDSIRQTYKLIEDSIYEALYNEIKGGTYSIGNEKGFSELDYIYNLYKNMNLDLDTSEGQKPEDYEKDLTDEDKHGLGITLTTGDETDGNCGHFTYKNTYDDWGDYLECTYDTTGSSDKRIKGFLTIKMTKEGTTRKTGTDVNIFDSMIYGKYIQKKIIPDIYRTLLIQNYVKEQRYSSLGRSYAREINMISYTSDNENYSNIKTMMSKFVEANITKSGEDDFEVLSDCLKGYYPTNKESYLSGSLDRLNISTVEGSTEKQDVVYTSKVVKENDKYVKYNVYKGTKLATLVNDINKVMEDPNKDGSFNIKRSNPDQTVENTLTNNGAYTIEEGIRIKEREILSTNLIKDGWQLKSGVTELTDDVKNKLFNITVSNIVDKPTKTFDYLTDYARYVNNGKAAYLVDPATQSSTEESKSITIGDPTGKKIAICEIKNAISTSKASLTNKNNYIHTRATSDITKSIIDMNTIMNGVLKVNASSDTYKKNANQYYLMITNIVFHDQSVYNYFKSQFPDLFK